MGIRQDTDELKLGALLVAVVAALALALPAQADAAGSTVLDRERYRLKSAGDETPGRAISKGKVVLKKLYLKKNRIRYRVIIKGRLNDICPADGYGAYLNLRAYNGPGTYSSGLASDQRGCETDAKRVRVKTGKFDYYPTRVTVSLYEYDDETGDIAFEDRQIKEVFAS